MSADGIFLRVASELVLLQQTPYDSEAILQTALAEHPEVIAGPTTEGDTDARLLLITREMGVPSAEGGSGTFSLDHLFIDHEGVPVLVEVKRSSDTRIRREVIGQMLDYAANAVKYWPLPLLHQSLQKRAEEEDKPVDELVRELRPLMPPDDFWRAVESNLIAGRIRMMFVADALPPELVRVIEFLNEQMSPAEVLGVELRQYVAGGHVAYVPRVVGRTAAAIDVKGPTGQQWTKESFLEAAGERCTSAEVSLMETLLGHAAEHGVKLSWGKGVTPGVGGWYQVGGQPTGVWALNANTESPTTKAYFVVHLGDVVERTTEDRIEAAARKLEQIPSMKSKITDARSNQWKKYPSVYLPDVVGDPAAVRALLDAIVELIDGSRTDGDTRARPGNGPAT